MNAQQHKTILTAALTKGSNDAHLVKPPRRKAVLNYLSAHTGLYLSPSVAKEVYSAYLCARQYETLWQAITAEEGAQ